ncbi:uncharacterized protein LOC130704185 [Daphnia carinata]|uniref:uncharacterized protein LOC130704185 n=1 Tax=Daphnia carinata TaxID=120202 RepID=UPI00257FA718|nr:uncharacterized protein LOC130704185 [Daphnia carinata]
MKVTCLAIVVALACASSGQANVSLEEAWEKFQLEYPLGVQTKAEYGKCKSNFAKTHSMIEAHNSNPNSTYQMEHNRFSVMDDEQMKKYLGAILPTPSSSQTYLKFAVKALPSFVDHRQHWCMQPAKDQGDCGSCWAFSATSVVEFGHCLLRGTKVALSEQQLVDCDRSNYACGKGNVARTWMYIANAGGQAASASYPYKAAKGTCVYNSSMKKATVSQNDPVVSIAPGDINTMMSLLAKRQLVSVAFAIVRSFENYRSGVYTEANCQSNIRGHHAVTLVGYGTANGMDYWIIRNSWGARWGAAGYVLFQKGKNLCGIESYALTTNVVG